MIKLCYFLKFLLFLQFYKLNSLNWIEKLTIRVNFYFDQINKILLFKI